MLMEKSTKYLCPDRDMTDDLELNCSKFSKGE